MGNEKAEWEFLSNSREICRHFVFFSLSKNSFLMSYLKVLTYLRNFISAARLFHALVQDRKWFFDRGSFVEGVGLV